jgi:hypothetical protein
MALKREGPYLCVKEFVMLLILGALSVGGLGASSPTSSASPFAAGTCLTLAAPTSASGSAGRSLEPLGHLVT